jgi:cell division inhibitor SepF
VEPHCVDFHINRSPGGGLAEPPICASLQGLPPGPRAAMETPFPQRLAEVVVMTPTAFDQATEAVLAVQQQRTVVLHLGSMSSEDAQRTIDFVSGGVYAMDGQSERLGDTVFLFAPALVRIHHDRESPP